MTLPRRRPAWIDKFIFALAGLRWSFSTQSSFWVHLPVAVAVLIAAAMLQVEAWRWSALVIVITVVWSAELLNTALEQIVRTLHPDHDERIGHALDAAAAAVLITAIGSVVIGLIVLGPPAWQAWVAES